VVSLRRLLLIAITAALLVVPAVASGHAALVSTSPAIGTIVEQTPTTVALTFNEGINDVGARVKVIGPDGKRYDEGSPAATGRILKQTLKSDLPEGTSTVAWSVISDDGHRIASAFTFSVGKESTGTAASDAAAIATETDERPANATTLTAIDRALRFAGIILLLGLLGIVALVWNPTLRRGRDEDPTTATAADAAFRPVALWLARLVPPALAIAALAAIPLEGWVNDVDLRSVFELRQGQVAVAQIVLALIAWPLAVRAVRSGAPRLLALAAVPAVVLAITPGLSGHAGAQSSALLAVFVDWVHVLAAGAWGGGLLVLAAAAPAVVRATTAETRGPLLRGITRRFTRIALTALVALVATGVVATLMLTNSLNDVIDTTWGRILLAKIAVVVAAVLAAGIARRASKSFAKAVQIEALLIVAAIALTGTLTGLAPRPPNATAAAASSSFQLVQKIEAREAQVDISPTTAGAVSEVHVVVTNGVGQPALDVQDATLELSQGETTKVPVKLSLIDTAHWTGTVRIPTPGTWRVLVRLRIGEFRDEVLTGTLTAT